MHINAIAMLDPCPDSPPVVANRHHPQFASPTTINSLSGPGVIVV